MTLIFGKNNKKLAKLAEKTKKRVHSFSLLSGHTCTFAKDCLAKVDIVDGKRKLYDGPDAKFRCFSASQEALYTAVYKSRKHNTDMIKSCGNSVAMMRDLIESSLPKNAEIIRVHVAGDYMTLNYMLAWLEVAKFNPDVHFYSYTKAVPLYLKCQEKVGIPKNFMFTMSRGGTRDDLIDSEKLKEAIVVNTEYDAMKLKLQIDTTDYLAAYGTDSFALLLHSQGAPGTEQAKLFASKKKRKPKKKDKNFYNEYNSFFIDSNTIKDFQINMNINKKAYDDLIESFKVNIDAKAWKSALGPLYGTTRLFNTGVVKNGNF